MGYSVTFCCIQCAPIKLRQSTFPLPFHYFMIRDWEFLSFVHSIYKVMVTCRIPTALFGTRNSSLPHNSNLVPAIPTSFCPPPSLSASSNHGLVLEWGVLLVFTFSLEEIERLHTFAQHSCACHSSLYASSVSMCAAGNVHRRCHFNWDLRDKMKATSIPGKKRDLRQRKEWSQRSGMSSVIPP